MMERKTEEWVISVDMSDPLEYNHAIIEKKPLVRCRECKFCHKNFCEKRISPTVSPSDIYWLPVEPDGFCAWGEKVSE